MNIKRKEALKCGENEKEIKTNFSFSKIFPWFILGFLAMSIVASVFTIPTEIVTTTKSISKFLMVCALAAIGLNSSFKDMKKSGIRPMIHGFVISALVVIVALVVEIALGIV
jgi:uncharacterized membrane protein YadS